MPIPIQGASINPGQQAGVTPVGRGAPVTGGADIPASQQKQASPVSDPASVDRVVASINRRLEGNASSLRFSLDKDTGLVVVKVVDTGTDQVIRQIPSEEVLAISHSLEKLQGLLLDHQA